MIKCKKCNSTNIKVDFDKVLTSIPLQYDYCCQDCGEHGYIDCDKVNLNYFDDDNIQLQQTNEDLQNNIIEPPKDEIKGGMMGWICPKCGRCYSPFTSMCSFCNNDNWGFTITC